MGSFHERAARSSRRYRGLRTYVRDASTIPLEWVLVRNQEKQDDADDASWWCTCRCYYIRDVSQVSACFSVQRNILIMIMETRIYTLNMSALSTVVEEARRRYVEVSKPHVIVYIADTVCIFPYLPFSILLSCELTNHTPLDSQAMALASSGTTSSAKAVAH